MGYKLRVLIFQTFGEMTVLKEALINDPIWDLSKNTLSLNTDDRTILKLKEKKSAKATFVFADDKYVVRCEGAWNQVTLIERGHDPVLMFTRPFLEDTGTITFKDGTKCSCRVSDPFPLKLSFFDDMEMEILAYSVDSTLKSRTRLRVTNYSMDEYKLLMLVILGCYTFRGILKELKDPVAITATSM